MLWPWPECALVVSRCLTETSHITHSEITEQVNQIKWEGLQ